MNPSSGSLPSLLLAATLVVATTIVQGTWTERWTQAEDGGRLRRAGQLLERVFPGSCGTWRSLRELPADPRELERAGAVGCVSRLFRDEASAAEAAVFVVCATPKDASGHTPDRCYLAAGFEIRETEHRETVPLAGGGQAETFVGTFSKQGQTLRIFWSYGVRPKSRSGGDGGPAQWEWLAPPGIARIALTGRGPVYKLYVIIDETGLGAGRAHQAGLDLIGQLLPAFAAGVAADATPGTPAPGTAASPGGDALREPVSSAMTAPAWLAGFPGRRAE